MQAKLGVIKVRSGCYRSAGGRYQITREPGRFRSQVYWRAIDLLPGSTFGKLVAVADTLAKIRFILSTKSDDQVPWDTARPD